MSELFPFLEQETAAGKHSYETTQNFDLRFTDKSSRDLAGFSWMRKENTVLASSQRDRRHRARVQRLISWAA